MIKLVSEDTVEEGIHNAAVKKLYLEREVTAVNGKDKCFTHFYNFNVSIIILINSVLRLIKVMTLGFCWSIQYVLL